ncbi:MAG: hypothetical protein ABW136_02760 [Steroidobacteraceae bacterium]
MITRMLLAAALSFAVGPIIAAEKHPAVASQMAGVWLPDGRHSGRLPREWPFTPAAQAAAQEYERRYGPIDTTVDDANASCIPEAFPYGMRLIAQYPFELLFTPDRVTVFFEVFGGIRRIELDPRAVTADPLPTTLGTSIGHWEGDVLVVETTRVRKEGAGQFSGNPPVSGSRKFIERLSIGNDAEGRKELRNQITLHDPVMLTRPVTVEMRYKWSPDIEVGEYLCQQDIWDQNQQGSPSSVPWRK